MNPVLPARTSTSPLRSRRLVLLKVMLRLGVITVYSGVRMIDPIRSSLDAFTINLAMS